MATTIFFNIQRLEKVYKVDLHEFEDGNAHSLASIMKAIRLADGTPKHRPWGNVRGDAK